MRCELELVNSLKEVFEDGFMILLVTDYLFFVLLYILYVNDLPGY